MKNSLKVVAAIIENYKKEILCALHSPEMSSPNHWAFPGGKVEEGEDIYAALTREIEEELGCTIKTEDLFHENTHEYETLIISLVAIKAKIIHCTPTPKEHSNLIWLKPENLDSLKWAPADIPAVQKLTKEK